MADSFRLSSYIIAFRSGDAISQTSGDLEMLEMLEEFSNFELQDTASSVEQQDGRTPAVVLLTGATGALGAHILSLLRDSPAIAEIICLVRAKDDEAATERVRESLIKRKKQPSDPLSSKIRCLACDLTAPTLGVSEVDMSHIRHNITHIIHVCNP